MGMLYYLARFLVGHIVFGSLAQSVEQLAFNQLVEGSNPSRPTINSYSNLLSDII